MTDAIYSNRLQSASGFLASIGAACFPAQPNKKPVFGWKWTENVSFDPSQWDAWLAEGHILALNADKSRLIVADIDTKGDRDEAWKLYCGLCAEWGIPVAQPAWQTPSGGWHVLFRAPAGVALSRQPDAIKGRINVRAGNGYVICPPSAGYALLEGATVHDAPEALIQHCSRPERKPVEHRSRQGEHSARDVRSMLAFMNEDGAFDSYEDWISVGQALKICFLDDGLEFWESITVPGRYTCEEKWPTFKDDDDGNAVTLATWFQRAREAGWRLSAAEMFAGIDVAKIVADAGATLPRRGLRARRVNAASLAGKPIPERQWLVRDLIPTEQVTLLYGDGATGKSLLSLQLATCAVTGTPWFGRAVKQGPVEFISAEDSADELHHRLADISRETGHPLERLDGLVVSSFADEDAIMAALAGDGQLAETAFYREVLEVVAETKPVLLVLDTLADVYGGNEVVRQQVRAFVSMLRKIAIAHHCAVVVLAHPSLAGMSTGKGTSGSTGWNNSVRSRLYMSRVEDESGRESDTDVRMLRSMKLNYGSAGTEIRMRYQRGVFVPDRMALGGDPIAKNARADRVFLELLAKAAAHNNAVGMKRGTNYAPAIFRNEASGMGVSKKELEGAMARLLDAKRIANVPYGPPSRHAFHLVITQ